MIMKQSRMLGLCALSGTMLFLSACLESSEGSTDSQPPGTPGTANSAPVISGNPASAITIGQIYSFTPNASDPDGDPLSFDIQNMPSWAAFNSGNGELSGQPLLGDEGNYADILIGVTDGQVTTNLRSFSISVTQASLGAATLSLIAPTTNTDGTPFVDPAGFNIYYGMAPGAYPNIIQIDNPGVSDYVVENLAPGTYYFVATAVNQSGIESEYSNEISRVVE